MESNTYVQVVAEDDELLRRALAAYYRATSTDAQPDTDTSRVVEHAGRLYVRLADRDGNLVAVFRVRAYNGILKRLRRWPEALD